MTDETWWRDEARRLYADVERLREELRATRAEVRLWQQVAEGRRVTMRVEPSADEAWDARLRGWVERQRKAPAPWVAP